MKLPSQEAPFAIQVETTLGCNLACSFCGIHGIGYQAGNSGFHHMTVENAEIIAKRIADAGWNSRIEFARRGEPTLNPNLTEIIAAFRRHLPRASMMITTNGAGLLQKPGVTENLANLFSAGLNTLAIDDYDQFKLVPRIRKAMKKGGDYSSDGEHTFWSAPNSTGLVTVYEYPAQSEGNPHKRRKPSDRHVVFIRDIVEATKGTHSQINNHGGYAGPAKEYNKPCAKPFRELSVNYDGTINHCCIAWAGEFVCGNILEQPISEIWNNERFFAVRQKLLRGQRDFGTCAGCDHPSTRVGLLPDKYGQRKDDYPPPDANTEKVLRKMEAEGPQIQQTQWYFDNKSTLKFKRAPLRKRRPITKK